MSQSTANSTIVIDSTRAEIAARDGKKFFTQKKYLEALEKFKEALEFDPENHTYNNNLGVIYSILGQNDIALQYGLKAVGPGSTDFVYHLTVSNIYNALKQYSEAVEHLKKVLTHYPDNHEYNNNIATMHINLDQNKEALKYALEAVRLDPQQPIYRTTLGKIHQSLGQDTQTLECFEKALTLSQDNPLYAYHVAIAHHTLGNYAQALKYDLIALKNDPNNPIYHNSAGLMCQALGKYKQALTYHSTALENALNNPQYNNDLGLTYRSLGDNENALKYLLKAATLEPSNPEYNHVLGVTYRELGNNEEAANYFNIALKLDSTKATYQHDFISAAKKYLKKHPTIEKHHSERDKSAVTSTTTHTKAPKYDIIKACIEPAQKAFEEKNHKEAIRICSETLEILKQQEDTDNNTKVIDILAKTYLALIMPKKPTTQQKKELTESCSQTQLHQAMEIFYVSKKFDCLSKVVSLSRALYPKAGIKQNYDRAINRWEGDEAKRIAAEKADAAAPDSIETTSPKSTLDTSPRAPQDSLKTLASPLSPKEIDEAKTILLNDLINHAKKDVVAKKFPEAIEKWVEITTTEPNNPTFRNNLGNAYFNNGQIDEAATAFKIATELNSKHPLYHNNLASAYYEQGNKDEALQEYATAAELDQKADQAKFHEDYADLLLELKPNSNAALFVAFMEYTKAGNRKKADALKAKIIEKHIKYLDLTGYQLNDVDLEILEHLLLETKDLRSLNLGNNQFHDGSVEKLSTGLIRQTALEKVTCSGKSVELLSEKAEDAMQHYLPEKLNANAALMDTLKKSPELINAMRDGIINPSDVDIAFDKITEDAKIDLIALRDIKNKLIFKATLSSYNKESKSFAPQHQDVLDNDIYDFDLIGPMKEAMSDGALAPTAFILLLNHIAPSEYKEISDICPKDSSYAQKYFNALAFRSENYKINEVVAQKFLAALYDAIDPSNKIHILEQLETSQLHNIIEMLNPTEDSVSLYYLAKAYLGLGKYEAAKTICGDLLRSQEVPTKEAPTKNKTLTPPPKTKNDKAAVAQKCTEKTEEGTAKKTVTWEVQDESLQAQSSSLKSSLKKASSEATKPKEISVDEFKALLNEITTKHTEYQKNSAIAADLITGVTKRPTTPPDTKHKVTKAEDANFDDEARANTPPQEAIIKWKINSIDYSYEPNCKTIVKVEGLINCYAAMTRESYNEITTPAEKDQFKTAIQQVVSGKVAKNGMKQLDTKCYEVKINGDNRLFCNKAYVVEGKYKLFIFDKYTDHRGIETLAKSLLIEQNASTNDNAIYQDGLELAEIFTEVSIVGAGE